MPHALLAVCKLQGPAQACAVVLEPASCVQKYGVKSLPYGKRSKSCASVGASAHTALCEQTWIVRSTGLTVPVAQALELQRCTGACVLDDQLAQLGGLRRLRRLSLRGCKALTGATLAAVAPLTSARAHSASRLQPLAGRESHLSKSDCRCVSEVARCMLC